ncbi:MAG: preprotein translocase subunit YajC [Brevinemataceae bacterium]
MIGLFYQLGPSAVAASNQAPATQGGGFTTFIPIIIMLVFMYLLVILPENKRRKKLQKQIDSLKQGDRVVTVGNIIGTIEFIGEKTVYIKSLDTKFEIAKTGIATVLDNGKI